MDDQNVAQLLEKLGLRSAPPLLEQALTHTSYAIENSTASNTSLAYLGDTFTRLPVTERLYRELPDLPEGELAKRTNWILHQETLAETARDLEFGPLLRLGKGEIKTGGRDKDKILATALQALIGAISQDESYSGPDTRQEHAQQVFGRIHGWAIEKAERGHHGLEWKARVQAWTTWLGLDQDAPVYEVAESGPDHRKTFYATLLVQGEPVSEASGRSKKTAELEAARKADEAYQSAFGMPSPPRLTGGQRKAHRQSRQGR